MKSISFSIARVDRLRRAAERARDLSDAPREPLDPRDLSRQGDGAWFASAYDANDLIRVFDTLRLKAGFALHAYVYCAGGDGNGIIWGVPVEASLAAREVYGSHGSPPEPLGAVPLMQVIEGDGSPWSYLSASILRREAAEFGASWHGLNWTCETILSKFPNGAERTKHWASDTHAGDWEWRGPAPKTWEPTYVERGSTKRVVLHIYNSQGDHIYRATDTYPAGSYDCTTKTRLLCTGRGGFLF